MADAVEKPAARYLVNLRQGRTGEEWRESTRTPQPVDWQAAETLFELALVERAAQGFSDPASAPEPVTPQGAALTPAPAQAALDPAAVTLLQQLQAGNWKIWTSTIETASSGASASAACAAPFPPWST